MWVAQRVTLWDKSSGFGSRRLPKKSSSGYLSCLDDGRHSDLLSRSGEVEIAYRTQGTGPIDLVFVQGWLTHLAVLAEDTAYRRFCERLSGFSRLILFDKRGMGLSDRTEVSTLEERMDDVRAILDALGSERAVLLGVSEGGPMSILFAATYPERTQALILCGGEVKEELTDDWPWGESLERSIRRGWPGCPRSGVAVEAE